MTSPPAAPIRRRLIAVDASVSRRLHLFSESHVPRLLLVALEVSADFRLFFPVVLSLFLAGASPELRRDLLVPLLLGLLLDLAAVGLVKFLFRRSRPVYNKDMSVAVALDHYSFPSGHSTRVCFIAAFATLSAAPIGDVAAGMGFSGGFVVAGVCAWAVVTSGSRVLLGRHYVTDVLAGAVLGVLEALFVFRYLRF